MAPERDKNMNLRISDDELRMLRAVAEDAGLTSSDYLRQQIRRAFIDRFGNKKPKAGKR